MEMLGIALAFPFAVVASIVYSIVAQWGLGRFRVLRVPALIASIMVLCALVIEVTLVKQLGAVEARASIGPAFTLWHVLCFFLCAPAGANVLLVLRGRWYFAAVTAFTLAIFSLFFNIYVSEKLYGIDGEGGPYSDELPN